LSFGAVTALVILIASFVVAEVTRSDVAIPATHSDS
jgi:hypothetical protein